MKTIFFILIAIIFLSSYLMAKDLVLYLSFDRDPGKQAKDLSKFGNDAEFNVEPKRIEGPLGNDAIQLDGITWGQVASSNSLNLTKSLTIEAWVLPFEDEKRIIVEKGPTWKVDGEYALLWYDGRRPVIQAYDLPNDCDDEVVGDEIPKNEWTFLAGTWDGTKFRLYINGKLNTEMDCPGTLLKSNTPLFIGTRGGEMRFMKGGLDEIKIYNYALSGEVIQRDMHIPQSVKSQMKLSTTWGDIKGGKR